MAGRLGAFIREDLWHRDAVGWRGVGISALRVVIHAFGSFGRNMGSVRAAGLSLITLLAIVPLLALMTALAGAFGYRAQMEGEIARFSRENLSAHLQEAVARIQDLAGRTDFRAIGVVGTLVLIYAGFELFTRVEQAFHHVWKCERRRRWYRRISDFIALIILVPILVLGALSLSSLLQGASLYGLREQYAWVRYLYEAGLGFVPHVLMWIAFTALYKAMPNTPVTWRAALTGGVVAGTGWIVLHALYIRFQIGVVQLSAIYATLAALPLLIGYLQLTWMVLLMGAELAYGVQNVKTLRRARAVPPPTHAIRRRLALLIMQDACRNFIRGAGGADLHEIAVRCDVPRVWVDGVCESLSAAGLLARLSGNDQVIPARPPEKITTLEVLRTLERGAADPFLDQIPLDPEMERRLQVLAEAEERALRQGF